MNLSHLIGSARRRAGLPVLLAALAGVASAASAAEGRVAPDNFFQNATMTGAELSPDGKSIAIALAASPKDRVRLLVMDARTHDAKVLAQYATDDVILTGWINDSRIAFRLIDRQASLGDLHSASGLFVINTDGSYSRQLINRYQTAQFHGTPMHEMLPYYTRYIGPGGKKHDPLEILVGEPELADSDGVRDLRLRLVNSVTHHSKDIETPIGADKWVIDADGEPRVTLSRKNDHEKIWLRDMATNKWSVIAEFNMFDQADRVDPLLVDDQGRLYVTARQGRDTRALYMLDTATGKLSDQPVVQSAHYDIEPTFITRNDKVIGIRYTVDAEVTKWLDPDMAAMQGRLDELLPATINSISVARDGGIDRVIVFAHSDRDPGSWYLYDAPRGQLVRLGVRHPEVDPGSMSAMEPVRYPARDGLQIPAWLTLPRGSERKNLPLVVLVHDGPWRHGATYAWDEEAQFLAARGYAVLQPQFRGSFGYGNTLFKAGWKQWGLAMQDDLADGVKWAVQQGVADPKRVCIAGGGYGGYAALMGLVKDPQAYRCGIDWVGPTDLDLVYTADWNYIFTVWLDYGLPKLVGDRTADAAQLKATSPLRNVDKIHAPLLLAYGGKNALYPKEHGVKLRDALMKQPGADVQWVLYDDEGHGWRSVETRLDFWNRAAAFLDKHIGQ
ncbi:MAG: alpha/beta hydrolase family protein [Vitreoscilla sp.]